MKKQLIYIHGGDSFSKREDFLQYLRTTEVRNPLGEAPERWTGTLRPLLGEEWEVYMPSMPNAKNARYDEWSIWFERFLEYIEDEVVLVGWSLGGMFLAKYLAEHQLPVKVKATFLLAAPGGGFKDGSGAGADCADFLPPEDLSLLAKQVPHIEVWHSEDDFVVPVAAVEWYKKHLPQAKIKLFKDKNHFLVPELPELIMVLKDTANSP